MEWNLKEQKEQTAQMVMEEQNKVGQENNIARKQSVFLQICKWNYVKVKTDA